MQEAERERRVDGSSKHRDKHKNGSTRHSSKDNDKEEKNTPELKEEELEGEIGTLKERLSFLEKSMKKAKEKA